MIDSVDVMIRGLKSVLTHNPDVFRTTIRRGNVYYDQSRGMRCRGEPATSWTHGHTILSHLRRVQFPGLTGPVAFDVASGHRTKFNLDIMSMGFDSEIKRVSRRIFTLC
jgi:Receptor family ligand binding region